LVAAVCLRETETRPAHQASAEPALAEG
jgi:hypothetical protein